MSPNNYAREINTIIGHVFFTLLYYIIIKDFVRETLNICIVTRYIEVNMNNIE